MSTLTAARADEGVVTRVLLIEDDPADALLTVEHLRRLAHALVRRRSTG